MKIAMRITLTITGIIWLITSFIVMYFSTIPKFERFTTPEFTCDVPKNCPSTPIYKNKWMGYSYKCLGNPKISYYISGNGAPDSAIIEQLTRGISSKKYSRNISLMKEAIFLLAIEGRCRRYIYIINSGKRIFWIETSTRDSTILEIKKIADRMALSLTADGCGASPLTSKEMAEIDMEIIKYSQSSWTILLFFLFISALCVFIVYLTLKLGGKMPATVSGNIIRKEDEIYFVRRSKFSYHGSVGAIVLTDNNLTVYYFGKPFLTVPKGEGNTVEVVTKGTGQFLSLKVDGTTYELHVSKPSLWLYEIRAHIGSTQENK